MAFIEVDEFNFEETISNEFKKDQIVILKFSSEFCDACMALEFELEDIDEENDDISILEIDCGQSEMLAMKYDIVEVPTMLIYKNANTRIFHSTGVMLSQDIIEIIRK